MPRFCKLTAFCLTSPQRIELVDFRT